MQRLQINLLDYPRYGLGVGETRGEVVGISVGPGVGDMPSEGESDSVGVGKAKVGAISDVGDSTS